MKKSKPNIWVDRREDIIKLFIPEGASLADAAKFFEVGKACGANPFLGEIELLKRGNKHFSFCKRDFYRRVAEKQQNYNGHFSLPIYSNDSFVMKGCEPEHVYGRPNRGNLIGAYCIVRRTGIQQHIMVEVRLGDYNTEHPIWQSKPQTMICKVAEAQALRAAYPRKFRGTYDSSEAWEERAPERKAPVEDNSGRDKPVVDVMPGQGSKEFSDRVIINLLKRLGDITDVEGFRRVDREWEQECMSKKYMEVVAVKGQKLIANALKTFTAAASKPDKQKAIVEKLAAPAEPESPEENKAKEGI